MRTRSRADALRAGAVLAALLVASLPATSSAGRGLRVVRDAAGTAVVEVPVTNPARNGPRSVAVRIPGLPAGVTQVTGTATPSSRDTRPGRASGAAATAGPVAPRPADGPDDARQFPVDAPDEPGTITTVAGGICDGYLATDATITPVRVAMSGDTLWWLDDDGSYWSRVGHDRGSLLIRMLTPDGRVRTVGPVIAPEEGRYERMYYQVAAQTALVADGAGGVYVAASFTHGGVTIGNSAPYGDEPTTTTILHVTADGTRTVVAGGGTPPAAGRSIHTTPGGDPALGASLARVTGMAADPGRGLYFVEADHTTYTGATVSYLNLGDRAVTFYPNTPLAVVVEPGRIGSIAGDLYNPTTDLGFVNGTGHGEGGPARNAKIPDYTNLAYHRGFLYLLALFQDTYAADTSKASPAEVEAVNLGLDGPSSVAGVAIPEGTIDRIAGVVAADPDGEVDGIPARAASFDLDVSAWQGGLAVVPSGDVVVADTLNERVRVVDGRSGIIRTLAGTGTYGYDGEGLPATASRVAHPLGLSTGRDGTVYVADVRNARIRAVGTDGRLTTVAGRGATPCGEGHLATGRTLYGGAYLGEQHDLATDSAGRIYVVDAGYSVVRRVGPEGRMEASVGLPSTCAYHGSGAFGQDEAPCPAQEAAGDGGPFETARLAAPHFVTVDSYDNLYVADGANIRYVNFTAKPVSVLGKTVAPGTIDTVYAFGVRSVHVFIPGWANTDIVLPIGDLTVDDDGSLYVADPSLYRVWKIDYCGRLSVVAGTGVAPAGGGEGDDGPALNAPVAPVSIALDRERRLLYLYDSGRSFIDAGGGLNRARIRVVNLAARLTETFAVPVPSLGITTVAGGAVCSGICSFGDGGAAREAAIGGNSTLALSDGRLYFADTDDNRVRVILPDGRVAGLAAPWPEARNASSYGPAAPSRFGTRGDGGRALDAWVAVSRVLNNVRSTSFGFFWWPAVLTTTRSGDLLVGDAAGRVRRIADPVHAPLRLSGSVPALEGAGAGFSTSLVLRSPDVPVGALTDPDLATFGGSSAVVGSLGTGGCLLWTVTANADGEGRDRASGGAAVGTGTPLSPVGGRGCRLSARSPDDLLVASTQDVRDPNGVRTEALLPVSATADGGESWRTSFADVTRAGAADRGAVAVAGDTVVYRGGDGTLHAVRATADGSFADAGSPGADVVSLGNAVTYDGAVSVAFVQAAGTTTRVVLARGSGGTWSASVVAVAPDASMPVVAFGRDGTAYVTWSARNVVHLATRPAGRTAWTSAEVGTGASPGVAAGERGNVVVAWYTTPDPRAVPGDPYARWYVRTAQWTPASATPYVRLATSTPVHEGAVTSELGPVQVRVGTGGRAEIAYRLGPHLGGNASDYPAIGFTRACTGPALVPATAVRCVVNPPSARRVADDIAPPPPPPPPLGNPVLETCSPKPPPFAPALAPPARRNPPRRPAVAPPDVPAVAAPVVGVVGAVVPPLQHLGPGEPEPLAGTDNANAIQQSSVTQPGYGFAPDEENELQIATASQRDDTAAELLAMVGLVSATAAAAWERRRRIRTAVATAHPVSFPTAREVARVAKGSRL